MLRMGELEKHDIIKNTETKLTFIGDQDVISLDEKNPKYDKKENLYLLYFYTISITILNNEEIDYH